MGMIKIEWGMGERPITACKILADEEIRRGQERRKERSQRKKQGI